MCVQRVSIRVLLWRLENIYAFPVLSDLEPCDGKTKIQITQVAGGAEILYELSHGVLIDLSVEL